MAVAAVVAVVAAAAAAAVAATPPPNKLALAGDLAADMCRHIMVEQLAELAPLRRSLLLHPKRFDFGIKKSLPLAVGVFNGRKIRVR